MSDKWGAPLSAFGGGSGGGVSFETTANFEQPYRMAVSPDGARLYVCDQVADSVFVFAVSDNSHVATIPVGSQPGYIVITPDGLWAYVATVGDGAVSVIDLSDNTVEVVIPAAFAGKMIPSPDSAYVYALNTSGNAINVIEVSSNTIIATPVIGTNSLNFEMTPDGAFVCVPSYSDSTVVVIETVTFTEVTTISLANFNPLSIVASPSSAHIYVGTLDNFITKISTSSWTVVGSPLAGQPFLLPMDFFINSAGTRLYVQSDGFRFYFIELTGFTVDDQGPDLYPFLIRSMILSPDGTRIYASHDDQGGTGEVIVVETSNPTVIFDTIIVSLFPTFLVSTPNSAKVFVSDQADGVVSVITAADDSAVPLSPGGTTQGPFDTLVLLPSATIIDLGGGKASVEIGQLIGPGEGEGSAVLNNETGNEAPGENAVAIGNGATASGDDSFAANSGNEAGGEASAAFGSNNIAKAPYSFVEGFGNNANGGASHAEGTGCTAEYDAQGGHAEGVDTYAHNGDGPHAEGHLTDASGDGAHAEGAVTVASGIGAHAEGVFSNAFGRANHAEGEGTNAYGEKSHAEGDSTTAASWASHSQGLNSYAQGAGVHAHACGPGTSATGLNGIQGVSQNRVIQMTAETPGSAPGETVELDFGYLTSSEKLTLGSPWLGANDHKGFTIVVTAIARGKMGSDYVSQSFRQMFSVLFTNVGSLEASGVLEQIGTASAASWTLVGSIGTSPERFRIDFSTGSTTANVRISAKVEVVEIYLPDD